MLNSLKLGIKNMNRIDEIFSYVNKRKNPEKNKITIGKIESSTVNGYWGTSYFSAALVPLFYGNN